MAAFDHRGKFCRIPNLLPDGDGIYGNVCGLGIHVFAKNAKGREIEPLKTALDEDLPVSKLHGTPQ